MSSEIVDNALLGSFNSLDIISTPNNQVGDVNFDNQVNIIDIVIMVNFILGVTTPTNEEFIAVDVNEDAQLNILDVVVSLQNILGIRTSSNFRPMESIEIEQENNSYIQK